jgi:hypothetical protein
MGAYDFNCGNCGKVGAGKPTGGSTLEPAGWVWNKSFGFGRKAFCSNKCIDEYNNRNSSDSNEAIGANQSQVTAAKNNAAAEKIRAEDEGYRLKKEQKNQMKEKLESKVKEIASIEFGSTKDSISDVLDQLVIIGSSKPSPKERKAIFDKMEIGIMKIKKIGDLDCSFYEQKMLKIKPTIWHKIGYYFANN